MRAEAVLPQSDGVMPNFIRPELKLPQKSPSTRSFCQAIQWFTQLASEEIPPSISEQVKCGAFFHDKTRASSINL